MFCNKIYPDKNDEDYQYNIIVGVIWGLVCCTCILILAILFMINNSDNSDSY